MTNKHIIAICEERNAVGLVVIRPITAYEVPVEQGIGGDDD